MTLGTIFLVIAFVCFLLAAFNVAVKRVSLLALGLAFWVLSLILEGLHMRIG
jgi:hypothetical protein